MDIKDTNLEVVGWGHDVNGNKIIKVCFPNQRAFAIQTGGNLPTWNREVSSIMSKSGKEIGAELDPSMEHKLMAELVSYIEEFGSKTQRSSLKKYKSVEEAMGYKDTVEKVKSELKSGKIGAEEAKRRMYAIADLDILDADSSDPELMDEGDVDTLPDSAEVLFDAEVGEVGIVEVERELDVDSLPIKHADENLEDLAVFVVANPELSDSEFVMVVDDDGDADDGVTIAKLTEDMQEIDHDATLELANKIAASLGEFAEVVNVNAVGVDAPDTVGDEDVLDEDGELLLDDEPEVVVDINEPLENGFEVVANPDGSITFLGDVAQLVAELTGDAAADVMVELDGDPLVDVGFVDMIESAKSRLRGKKKRLAEASEEEYARVVAEEFGVDADDVVVSERDEFGVDYADVEVNGEEYMVFESHDDAARFAVGRIEEDVEDDPYLFSPDFLINYMYINDTDKRLMASEDANAYIGDMDDDEVIEHGDVRDEYDEAVSDGNDELAQEIVDKARDEWINSYEDEMIDLYDDIQGYFMDELGYDMEQLMNLSFIHINVRDVARDAVNIDGVAHFLNHYDGTELDLPDGFVAYRTN